MSLTDGPSSDDAANDGPPIDDPAPDVLQAALGMHENPARTCAELQVAGMPSAAYWIRHPDSTSPAFQVYCEQQLNGGGWAMLENSVRRDDGATTVFWQFKYDDRLKRFGMLAADENYYDGSLYLIGIEYMDVFVDLQDTTRVAALMTATGIDQRTMELFNPKWIGGNADVYDGQFASGWSAQNQDFDRDQVNCATEYGNVAQHYGNCWVYNLGADADAAGAELDGGVGPHVENDVLTSLGLALQPDGGNYSQVKRIARFTRW